MYTKEQIVAHPCKQGFEKKGATQTDAESKKNSRDETDRATMRSTTHTSKYVCVQTKRGKKTQLLNSRQRNQGYQKTWSAQRIQTISKTRISSTPAEHDRGLSIQFVTKLRDPWPSENTETQKPSHTEGRKTTPILTKCLDRADTLQNCGSFHIPRCAVTAIGLKSSSSERDEGK